VKDLPSLLPRLIPAQTIIDNFCVYYYKGACVMEDCSMELGKSVSVAVRVTLHALTFRTCDRPKLNIIMIA